jgi:hypothetical protein
MGGPLPPALANLGSKLTQMAADVATLKRQARTAQLANSSVDNGSILFTDESQNPQILVGLQPDGTFAQVHLSTDPPDQPADPLVAPGIQGLYAIWDGLMADGTSPLANFLGVQVHASPVPGFTPDTTTLQGTLTMAGIYGIANLTAGTTYYVLFVPVIQSGTTGENSNYISGVPDSVDTALEPGSITGDKVAQGTITGANIAANTVAAVNLTAGIVVAGIVDATQINSPTLISSVILGYATAPRGPSYFDFEDGTTQGWVAATNCAVANSATWSSTGTNSLKITANGAGQPKASSAPGLLGVPVSQFDPVSLKADIFCPAALSNVYVGIQFYDPTGATLLAEYDSTDAAFISNEQDTLEISANAPAAGYAVYVVGDHHTDTNGTLIYADNILASGNLAFSASEFGGVDSLGNSFGQGIEVNGINGLLEAIVVTDPWGQTVLAAIDGQGNISGQVVSGAQDVYVQGASLVNTILPGLPQGILARTNVGAASLPAPGTPTASEFFLYQLDVQAVAGRHYLLVLEPMTFSLSGQGKVRTNVYATTDGTQPTNASPLLESCDAALGGASVNTTICSPTLTHPFDSAGGALWRFLVSINSIATSGGAPTMQLVATDSNPGDDANLNTNARLTIYDMGENVPNTGRLILSTSAGSGSGKKNHTNSYLATASYSYQGSDGVSPNARINSGGSMYQGGDQLDTGTGHAKTWIVFNYSQIASDLSGATINSIRLMISNARTWFASGMTIALGWDTKTVWPATLADPSGGSIDIFEFAIKQGQSLNQLLPNAFATAFKSSSATSLVLYTPSNALSYYGYLSGASQFAPPELIINYTV